MNFFKTTLAVLLLSAVPVFSFAQDQASGWKQLQHRMVISSVELNDSHVEYELLYFPAEDHNDYYLNVGHVGVGDEIVQVYLDPLFTLYVKIGSSMSEAIATMEKLKEMFSTVGSTMELEGNLGIAYPTEKTETVYITCKKPLLSKYLDFSLKRDGYLRSAACRKSEIGSLTFGLKTHSKINPKLK